MKFKINNEQFKQDILDSIKKEFADFERVVDVEDNDFGSILLSYQNWRKRFIGLGYRKVLYSEELKSNPIYTKQKNVKKAIDKIAYKLRNSEDLTPFLSKAIADHPISAPKNKDKDLMLNALGIHHLHIGNEYDTRPKNGINFVTRNSEILFAVFQKDTVYLVDIYEHEFPYKHESLETIQKNWDYLLEPYEIKGISRSDDFSEDRVKKLTNAHVNSMLEINDKTYAMQGVSTSGHSTGWMFDQFRFFEALNSVDACLHVDSEKFMLEQLNLTELDIGIVIKDGLLYFVEKQTSNTIRCQESEDKIHLAIFDSYCVIGSHSIDFNS